MIIIVVALTVVLVIIYWVLQRFKLHRGIKQKAQQNAQLSAHPDALAVRLGRFAEQLQMQADEGSRLAAEALERAHRGEI